jgi:hypothetical protein
MSAPFDRALRELRARGLLLLSDPAVPSVAGIVAGAPVRGSWWSHPKGRAIFAVASRLGDHPEVAVARLVNGKVTFVHRRLASALASVGAARETWQMRGLSPAARRLLARVDREGEVQCAGEAVRELERRILLRTHEVHTAEGKHAKVARPWPATRLSTSVAIARLEAAAERLGPTATLPWQRARKTQSARSRSSKRGGRTSRFISRSSAS